MDLHEERVQMTIMTRNITSSANTVMSGMISALSEVRIHLEFLRDTAISSFDARSIIKNMVIIAPPTPRPGWSSRWR